MNIKWNKSYDFIDNSPRYTFGGRDPQSSVAEIVVVIYTQKERDFPYDTDPMKNYYYGYVRHNPSETSDTIGRFKTIKEAKQKTTELFNEYCLLFPNDTMEG